MGQYILVSRRYHSFDLSTSNLNSLMHSFFNSMYKNTKLDAIGTVVTGTLTTALLASSVFYSAGSITLTADTWIINTNACFSVITVQLLDDY